MKSRREVAIKNNSDLIINGSTVICGDNNILISGRTSVDNNLFFDYRFRDIIFTNSILINSCEKRTILLNEKIEQLIFCSKQANVTPTIRTYGYFTSFSTIRQPSETSDIAKLELLEKNNLIKMAKLGFHIKAIVALDIERICSICYSKQQCEARYNDLYSSIYDLDKYPNVELVFDDGLSFDSLWILDSLIKVKAFNIDIDLQRLNYNTTLFESNLKSITISIESFDLRFEELRRKEAWRYQKKLKQSDYVKKVTQKKLSTLLM